MDGLISGAVIFGQDNFVAIKLGEKLREQGIKVVNGDLGEVPNLTAYIFDFVGREDEWDRMDPRQKLVLVSVKNGDEVRKWQKRLGSSNLNWRIVVAENVYGEGMSEEGFLGEAFLTAAKNKNLVLPSLDQDFGVLAADDLVEAILRACFFSGTVGKILLIGGRKVNSKIVAEVLLDEAKMTKTRVIQNDVIETQSGNWDPNLAKESEKLLRWQPELRFKEGAREVVQYFVAKVDTDNRKKATSKRNDFKPQIERDKVEKRYEVEIEDEYVEVKEADVEIELDEEIIESKEEIVKKISQAIMPTELDTSLVKEKREKEEEEIVFESFKKNPVLEREEKVDFRNEILEITEKKEEKRIEERVEAREEKGEKKGGDKKGWWRWGGVGLGLVFLTVFLVNIIRIATIPKRILGVQTLIETGDYAEAEREIGVLSKRNVNYLNFMGKGRVGTILRVEAEVIDLLSLSLDLVESSEKLSRGMFDEEEIEMEEELVKIEKSLEMAISRMGILQGRLSGQWTWLPGRFRGDLNKLKESLAIQRNNAEKIREILLIMPELLGLDGKRRDYMVLLQNENEIRPSGGFIGSFAILSFEAGRFLNFEVMDVYEADGQLKGHVEPPEEIKKYLGEAAWFMRDANWQASFPLVSRDIQWFLDKAIGRKVNGVIGINLTVVKAILGITGEVFVPDFNEKVNENNLYEQAEFYSDDKFFPGSVQKASFLGGVSKQLMEEIKSARGSEGQKLLTSLIELLERNEVQIALNNNEAARVMGEAGWDGSLYEGKCNGDKCIADYLYVVEANLGVNKANYFLHRNMERQVEISEKVVKNTLKIIYENTAKTRTQPAGDYKNYLRIYLPVDARVEEVNWSENGRGEKRVISGENLKIRQLGSKREVGFLVTVPIEKKIDVEVKYSQSIDLSSLQTFSYLNYIQKQSGFGETNLVTLVSIPDNWQISAVEPAASVVGGKLLFSQKLDKDIKMGVEIVR